MLMMMTRAVWREMLMTLAPRKKPFGTVVGRVSFGISVVWYHPMSFTRYPPTEGSFVPRNRPPTAIKYTFSPGENGRTMASMLPPMKLLTRSFAARPKVRPPMPPNPSSERGGRPNTTAELATEPIASATVSRRVSTKRWLASLMLALSRRKSGNQWSAAITEMTPAVSVYIPRSNCAIVVSGSHRAISRSVPTRTALSNRYSVIHSAPTACIGFFTHL